MFGLISGYSESSPSFIYIFYYNFQVREPTVPRTPPFMEEIDWGFLY
jgi:hypothetical protein